jgi:hypothetical protein
MPVPYLRLHSTTATLGLAMALVAQEPVRWVAELGDAERGEAAERALIAAGTKAVPALQELLEAFDVSTPRDQDRLRAALRVADLLGEDGAELLPTLMAASSRRRNALHRDLVQAAGSLTPYAPCAQWHTFWSGGTGDAEERTANFVLTARLMTRSQTKIPDAAEARDRLRRDQLFEREVAAEVLGKLRDAEAIDALSQRLLERDKAPAGADLMRYNGFPLPTRDGFALRAAMALVRIAPDDPRSAIGHAVLAVEHPHRTVRQEALRALAGFGPASAVAIPELLKLATGDDPAVAIEALKALGMAGKDVGNELATIDRLAASGSGALARVAGSLAARLRAMGCEPRAETAGPADADPATTARLQRAVAALAGSDEAAATAAEAELLADPAASWPLLVLRYRENLRAGPERIVQVMGRVGRQLDKETTEVVRGALATTGDSWAAPRWSASSGGGGLRACDYTAYAELTVGKPGPLADLLPFLSHGNAAVRLVAARDLAARSAEIAAAPPTEAEPTVKALLEAARGTHPEQSPFERGRGGTMTTKLALGPEIRAAAAAALLPLDHEPPLQAELLRAILGHPDVALVAKAVARWGPAAATSDLEEATKDSRPPVAEAARTVLEQRRAGK